MRRVRIYAYRKFTIKWCDAKLTSLKPERSGFASPLLSRNIAFYSIVSSFFSAGAFIALMLDYASDKKINDKIVLEI